MNLNRKLNVYYIGRFIRKTFAKMVNNILTYSLCVGVY